MTGTLWHDLLGKTLAKKGWPVMLEVKMEPFMPGLWSGTSDWLLWHPEYQAFVLTDVKTTGERAMAYVPKIEHLWQTSLYYYTALDMGLPIVNAVGIFYIPLDVNHGRRNPDPVSWQLVEFDPVDRDVLYAEMEHREERVKEYLESLPLLPGLYGWGTEALEPEPERIQALSKDKEKYEVKLVPAWFTDYCDFPENICGCSKQGSTKIGEWVLDYDGWDGNGNGPKGYVYKPRRGYSDIEPTVAPKKG